MSKPAPAPVNFAALAADIVIGAAIARTAAADADDLLGSCNFDAPALRFDRMPSPKTRTAYETACAMPGYWIKRRHDALLVFGPGCGGQGLKRTVGAEALRGHLVAQGWDAVMYYAAD